MARAKRVKKTPADAGLNKINRLQSLGYFSHQKPAASSSSSRIHTLSLSSSYSVILSAVFSLVHSRSRRQVKVNGV